MALQILLSMIVVGAVITALAWPILRGVDEPEIDAVRAELEDAKQAKYRQIRDAELDYRSGKLTTEQWEETDRELRREALQILAKMDNLGKDAVEGKSTPEVATDPEPS